MGTDPRLWEKALEGLVAINTDILTSMGSVGNPTLPVPGLYHSGVVYRPEPPGREQWLPVTDVYARGHGDCEDIAAIRIAEDRVSGADPGARPLIVKTGRNRYHAQVLHSDGSVEDPTKILKALEKRRRGPRRRKKEVVETMPEQEQNQEQILGQYGWPSPGSMWQQGAADPYAMLWQAAGVDPYGYGGDPYQITQAYGQYGYDPYAQYYQQYQPTYGNYGGYGYGYGMEYDPYGQYYQDPYGYDLAAQQMYGQYALDPYAQAMQQQMQEQRQRQRAHRQRQRERAQARREQQRARREAQRERARARREAQRERREAARERAREQREAQRERREALRTARLARVAEQRAARGQYVSPVQALVTALTGYDEDYLYPEEYAYPF